MCNGLWHYTNPNLKSKIRKINENENENKKE